MKSYLIILILLLVPVLFLSGCTQESAEIGGEELPLITHDANDEDPSIVKANGIYYVAWYSDRSGNPDICRCLRS